MVDRCRPYRSYLYVAGHRADHIEGAYRSEADAIVLELEDAVAPMNKDAARRMAVEVLSTPLPKPTYVRINPLHSGLARADVDAVGGLPVEGLRVAKVRSPSDVRLLGGWLDEAGSDASLQLLLESALAVERAYDLLRAHWRVLGAALGEQDLIADVGMNHDDGLLYPRSRLVFAARAAGLPPPVQSVWTDLEDEQGLRSSCLQGRRLGFFGRSAIHPSQVAVINDVYTPSAEEIARAEELERLLEGAVESGAAGVRLPDGRFLDRAVVLAARRSLALRRQESSP